MLGLAMGIIYPGLQCRSCTWGVPGIVWPCKVGPGMRMQYQQNEFSNHVGAHSGLIPNLQQCTATAQYIVMIDWKLHGNPYNCTTIGSWLTYFGMGAGESFPLYTMEMNRAESFPHFVKSCFLRENANQEMKWIHCTMEMKWILVAAVAKWKSGNECIFMF